MTKAINYFEPSLSYFIIQENREDSILFIPDTAHFRFDVKKFNLNTYTVAIFHIKLKPFKKQSKYLYINQSLNKTNHRERF